MIWRNSFHYLTISAIDLNELDANVLCNLLLFGIHDLNIVQNRMIIEGTASFIEESS